MKDRMRRRKRRYTYREKQNLGMKIVSIIVIIALAVGLGYCTARFIVGPLFGYDMSNLDIKLPDCVTDFFDKFKSKEVENREDDDQKQTVVNKDTTNNDKQGNKEKNVKSEKDSNNTKKSGKFALQFGAFSSKSAANELVSELKYKNIETQVKIVNGSYKVFGKLFDTKDEAKAALAKIDRSEVKDVFVAEL